MSDEKKPDPSTSPYSGPPYRPFGHITFTKDLEDEGPLLMLEATEAEINEGVQIAFERNQLRTEKKKTQEVLAQVLADLSEVKGLLGRGDIERAKRSTLMAEGRLLMLSAMLSPEKEGGR